MDSQLIGAGAIMLLAYFGVVFEMDMPSWAPLLGSAVIGSVQASTVRIRRGFIKGIWSVSWAFVAGVTAGMIIGQAIGAMMGFKGSVAMVLPVYLFSLFGSRLVMWFSTDVDVAKIGQWFIDRLTKSKN